MLESLIVSAGTPSGGTAGSIAAAGVVRIGLRSSTGGGARAATGNPRSDFRIRPAGPLPTISLISIFFAAAMRDRKSVVSGKSVSVRVDLGGRRILNTKTKNEYIYHNTSQCNTAAL